MRCEFCKKEAEKVIYLYKNNYHVDFLSFLNSSIGEQGKVFYCSKCENRIDFNKYILFNTLNGFICPDNCLKKATERIHIGYKI